jgi:hypothetical protein
MIEDVIGNATKAAITIAAVGPIILAFYNRHLILIQRLRGLNRELIAQYEKPSLRSTEIVTLIKQQIKAVNKTSFVLNISIVLLLVHVNCQATCIIFFGINVPSLFEVAHIFFVIGMCFMWLGTLTGIIEVSLSLKPVIKEEEFVLREMSTIELTTLNTMACAAVG